MTDFVNLAILSFNKDALKKIVFSRPFGDNPDKISARLCSHRGQKILSAEFFLPGNTVSQKNLRENEIEAFLEEYIEKYGQVNLITAFGDAEIKSNKKGRVLLGADKLLRKLLDDGAKPKFEIAIESLEREKKRILKGDEPFLVSLGISDKPPAGRPPPLPAGHNDRRCCRSPTCHRESDRRDR